MNGALIFPGSGAILVLTSHSGLEDASLLERLARKGIRKFIAFPVPTEVLAEKYGEHYRIVCEDLKETDDLRVLDFDGRRALELLPFKALGQPIFHESR